VRAVAATFLLLLLAAPASSQVRSVPVFPAAPPPPAATPVSGDLTPHGAAEPGVGPAWMRTPAGAFGSSLVVPGLGQAALGLRRWVAYGVVELGFWGVHLDARWDERRFRGRYRDLAWDVAREQSGMERQDAGWGYYEAMSRYLSSGAYDIDPTTPGLQPETDPATFNGSVWDLAQGIYLPGGSGGPGTPGYDRALAYYTDHAAGPSFLWDWSGQEAELERFRSLIRRSDDEARLASGALGLVLANHLVAAIDALIVARLWTEDDVHLESGFYGAGPSLRWRVSLELTTPY
jgi:hypothetical protein